MKKFLLPVLLLGSISLSAQNQTISFETNEGYELGSVLGQNSWEAYGYIYDEYANVINHSASVGTQAVEVETNDEVQGNWGGLIYELPQSNKFIISADIKLTGDFGSDYDLLSLYSIIGGEYEYISGFYFVYDGETSFGSETNSTSPIVWEADTWYNLKSDVDFTTREIKLYVNNSLVNTIAIPAGINAIDETNFEFDNYGTGYIVDNIQFSDLTNLGLSDFTSTTITIFPNPTTDILNITGNEKVKSLEILDFTGKSVTLVNDTKKINVQSLPQGIYLLKITTDKGTETKKFIKK